jgi:hypothetical protein
MSRLTPEAEKLVQAGRAVFRPDGADRERVFRALLPKLGAGAAFQMSAPSHAPAAANGMLVKSAVVVGLGIAGAGLFFGLRPEPMPTQKAAVVAPAIPAPKTPAPGNETAGAKPVTPEAPPAEQRTTLTPRPADSRPDSLAQEVALLSRASSELHGGNPQAALAALDEHQRKFPGGVLTQERSAARVQALCALGRTKEAQSELARLARTSPNSPLEARARKACGSALAGKK